MRPKISESIGKTFGFLTILYPDENALKAICKCICGKICSVHFAGFFNTKYPTKSCGCTKLKYIINSNLQHGKSYTYEYNRWRKFKSRCLSINNNKYKSYGARGIAICERWKNSFENFLEDMGNSPSNKHTIDRINNNGNYCKENCRWATKIEQANNTRTNTFITFNNKTQTIAQWSRELEIGSSTISARLKKGWSIERVLSKINTKACTNTKGTLISS